MSIKKALLQPKSTDSVKVKSSTVKLMILTTRSWRLQTIFCRTSAKTLNQFRSLQMPSSVCSMRMISWVTLTETKKAT